MINEIIDNLISPDGTGIPPKFTSRELIRMEQLGADNVYWLKAHGFAHAYNRGAEKWDMMFKKQRDWLWKIKDDIANVVKQDRQKCEDSEK